MSTTRGTVVGPQRSVGGVPKLPEGGASFAYRLGRLVRGYLELLTRAVLCPD